MRGRRPWRDELRAVLKDEFGSLTRAAPAMGLSRPFLSMMLRGHRRLSVRAAARLAQASEIDGLYFLERQLGEEWYEAMQP